MIKSILFSFVVHIFTTNCDISISFCDFIVLINLYCMPLLTSLWYFWPFPNFHFLNSFNDHLWFIDGLKNLITVIFIFYVVFNTFIVVRCHSALILCYMHVIILISYCYKQCVYLSGDWHAVNAYSPGFWENIYALVMALNYWYINWINSQLNKIDGHKGN